MFRYFYLSTVFARHAHRMGAVAPCRRMPALGLQKSARPDEFRVLPKRPGNGKGGAEPRQRRG
jgi:hypothetical protein